MATEITMPQMGFDMTEGTVAAWLKKVGDVVKKGEPIAEIETDKTTMQVEAYASGTLIAILTEAGQKVPVNSVIGAIGDPSEAGKYAAGSAAPKPTAEPVAAPVQAAPTVTAPISVPAVAAAVASAGLDYSAATAIEMPQMGFDMTEGTVAAWLKKEGDVIKKGEVIAEIETDKTTMQMEAFASGTLLKILTQPGEKVAVKTVIGYIGDPALVKAGSPTAAPAARVTVAAAVVATPTSSVVVTGGGEATPVARRMAEELKLDLSKVTGSGPDGRITKGDVEAYLASAPVAAPAAADGRIIASPYARRMAEAQGLDLSRVKGSGPEGRVMADDVKVAAASGTAKRGVLVPAQAPVIKTVQPLPAAVVGAATSAAPTSAAPTSAAPTGKKAFTRMRQTIAKRMTDSKQQVPHYYLTMQVEMDAALTLRAQVNDSLKGENIKVSVNDLVVKALATALRKYPNFNATFAGDGIELREVVHIGIAVAMDSGLLVITLRDADKKSLKQIGAEVPALAARVREGKAQPGDMGGQTFTTSNLGMYGVESVYPIINQPDSGILGIGASTPTAVVRDGQIVVRNIMHLTLAGDHRVTDGAEGAQFLGEIRKALENPWSLVL